MKKALLTSIFIALVSVSCSSNSPAHKHDLYDVETVLVPRTCETDGALQIDTYCSTCDKLIDTRVEVYPAAGHDLYFVSGLEPTCETSGYTDFYQCRNCEYSTREYLPPIGHRFDSDGYYRVHEIEATCTFPGSYDVYAHCLDCDEAFFIKTEYIPAKGHNLVHHDGKDPTCIEMGYQEYDYCTECDYEEISYIIADGHHEGRHEVSTLNEATCTREGNLLVRIYCEECDVLMHSLRIKTQPLGHDYIYHDHLDATCKNPGHYQYETCSRCYYSSYIEIGQLNHKLVDPVIKDYHFDEDDPYVTYAYPCLYCEEEISTEIIRPSHEVADLKKYCYSLYPGVSIDLELDNNFSFSSNNPSVAGVSMDGKLVTFKDGEALITVTDSNDPSKNTFILVKVSKTVLSFELSVNSICVEHNLSITNLVLNSSYSQEDLTFASENLNIARINDNMTISTVGVGRVKIHAFINHTSIHYVQELEVINNYLVVNQTKINCYVTKNVNLKNYVYSTLQSDVISFDCSDETIGYVSYSGVFYGTKIGTVTVGVTSLKSGSTTLTISVIARPTVSINSSNYSQYVRVSLSWSSNYYTCTVYSRYEVASAINIHVYCGYDSWGSHTSFDFTLNNTNSQTSSMRFIPASGQSASLSYNVVITSGSVYTA